MLQAPEGKASHTLIVQELSQQGKYTSAPVKQTQGPLPSPNRLYLENRHPYSL